MFSNRIIGSARFIKMPPSIQALYFHLCLNADDDGVVEAYPIMRMLGSTEDDVRILNAKNLVTVLNEDLVSHITDWLEHNSLRADRKVDSVYQKLLLQMVPEAEIIEPKPRSDVEDNSKRLNGQSTDGIGKDRIGKEKKESDASVVPPKTYKNFRDQARARIGNPPMAPIVPSEKQAVSLKSMKLLSRIHDAGVERGWDYLNEEDEQANRKYQGLVKPFEKRYPTKEQQDEYIAWFFDDPSMSYANGHPSNFFSVATWSTFDNRKNVKPKENNNQYKKGVW